MPAGKSGGEYVRLKGAGMADAEPGYYTPDDNNDLPKVASEEYPHSLCIMVGGSGDVEVTLYSGVDLVLPGLAGGVMHPVHAVRVKAALTTATNIVVGYEGRT